MRLAIVVLGATLAVAAQAQDPALVVVRGGAWDSLRMAPLQRAFVAIAGTARTTMTDERGRWRFDSVPPGQHTFLMQHDVLEQIGFSGRSARVMVDKATPFVVIAIPSFATLWRGLCGGPAPKDSGIVYGMVRDVNDKPLAGASIGVTWKDVSYKRKTGLDWKDMAGTTTADSTGRYALCGVPVDVALHLAASADSMVSGAVEQSPLTHRVARRDFRLARNDALGQASARGTVMGVVSGEGGRPLAGALILVDGTEEVRSGEDGKFIVRDVPAGTRQMDIRAIGAAPQTTIVDVTPNDTTEIGLSLGKVQTLEEVQVKGRTFVTVMLRNIDERSKLGLAYVRDSVEIAKLPHTAAVIDGIAGVRVCRTGAIGAVFVGSQSPCSGCQLAVWIDRISLDAAAYTALYPRDIALIEVFGPNRAMPVEFRSKGKCGAIVVWTKRFLRS